jgi:hypothetical protein
MHRHPGKVWGNHKWLLNLKLLKKVEELTLYMIEQNRTITKQQSEINALKDKVK